jgi:Type II secretion system (T2SS), protein M subtype b
MRTQLSQREKILATVVGSVVLLLLNVVVIKFFVTNQRRLREEFATKTLQLDVMRTRYENKEKWAALDAWLKEKQPVLVNEGRAGGELLDEVREVAKKTNVQDLEPQILDKERRPLYVSIPVTIEAKATPKALRDFLYEMQGPERFIVFESAKLQIDKEDKALMHCTFRVAKWYAPK